MLRVLADNIHPPPALDDLALFASDFHGCSNLHDAFPLSISDCGLRISLSISFSPQSAIRNPQSYLSVSVRDPPARRIIGREFHFHPVTRQNPDEVDPHLPGDMRQHPVTAGQLDPEHRIGQHLHNRPFNLDRVLLRHPSPRPCTTRSARAHGGADGNVLRNNSPPQTRRRSLRGNLQDYTAEALPRPPAARPSLGPAPLGVR